MGGTVRLSVLGPVEVAHGDRLIPVPGPQLRCVLAVLASEAGRVLPVARLAEALWDVPPPTARGTLQVYASRLRKLLGGLGVALVGTGGGYRLDVDPADVDLHRFRDVVARARATADVAVRRRLLATALGEWRGAPLADTADGPLRNRLVVALAEERLAALEDRLEADLELGRHHDVVGDLTALAAEHPGRERVAGALMLALHRCGRRVEALEVYRRLRGLLIEQAGVEPGADLRHLHQRLLADADTPAPAATPTPRQLPAAGDLVAREGYLAELDALLTAQAPARQGDGPPSAPAAVAGPAGGAVRDRIAGPAAVPVAGDRAALSAAEAALDGRPAGPGVGSVVGGHVTGVGSVGARFAESAAATVPGVGPMAGDRRGVPAAGPVVVALVGTPGVGKTALALRWAHRVADRFPDGQLYADLGGHGEGEPAPPRAVLGEFLRALGVHRDHVPESEAERSALCRSLLADRRVLLVLDNARSAEQVRPLLPGAPGCAVVVTSRAELAGLAARDGAHPIAVVPLSTDDGVALLRGVLGRRVDVEPAAAARLVDLCGGLPLALRVVAHRAVRRPSATLTALAAQLADETRRIDLLSPPDDPSAAVRAVFSWSYRALPPDVARVFRLLGVLPGSDFDAEAAGAATGSDVRHELAVLASGHLVEEIGLDRYRLHDLLRVYAAELADPDESAAAVTRVLDWYLDRAAAAVAAVATDAGPGDRDTAARWLEAEHRNLVAATRLAATSGLHEHAWRLPNALWRHWFTLGRLDDWTATHEVGLTSARVLGDIRAQAETLNALGVAHQTSQRHTDAVDAYEQALALWEELRDHAGAARTLTNIAVVHYLAGRYRDAVEQGERVLALRLGEDDAFGEAVAHTALGGFHLRLGDPARALDHAQRALTVFEKLANRFGVAAATLNLGHVHRQAGEPDRAATCYHDALIRFRELGDQRHEGEALCGLGSVHLARGGLSLARDHLDAALAVAAVAADPLLLGEVRYQLGLLRLATGEPELALRHFEHARRVGGRYERARGRLGMARAECAAGRHGEAARSWRAAAEGFAALGVPDRAVPDCGVCAALVRS
ncbi:AfsR/SARP family transcriptional regulator [Saccharothrix luteola]|uniref:AfsR/SARP family transcriptional regulator n=1 Tax=Saccharothrix luteola TaxID=2893018 RepID=UPI001E2F8B30|nr:BTAD domain-containing putative transcriptional regulator [Saccharothrix luteola]MCC8250214.1 tetratricopeptide repeat protein [Saccharothrix luteola]